jgi:hypothetical protein
MVVSLIMGILIVATTTIGHTHRHLSSPNLKSSYLSGRESFTVMDDPIIVLGDIKLVDDRFGIAENGLLVSSPSIINALPLWGLLILNTSRILVLPLLALCTSPMTESFSCTSTVHVRDKPCPHWPPKKKKKKKICC